MAIWQIQKTAPEEYFQKVNLPRPLAQTLFNRGIKTEEIDNFLNPNYETDQHNPFLLKGMEKAADLITEAMKENKRITIYSDYDADGVCSAAILWNLFVRLEYSNFEVYIPGRVEGFGLSRKKIQEIKDTGGSLIITCDCGITDFEEIKLAKDLGMKTIVTDHHLPISGLPEADAIVDAFQPGDDYPFKKLSGAGVAFKLLQAVALKLNYPFKESLEKWSLDLVAFAAIADRVPLLDENRLFVKFGILVLGKDRRPGFKYLKLVSGLSEKERLTVEDVAFILAPRINVANRMDHANTAFELLITDSEEEARTLAERLNTINQERQLLVAKSMNEIEAMLKEMPVVPKIIILGSKNWPLGVVAIMSGRLAERYRRPSFIYNESAIEIKGSARTIPSFDLVAALKSIAEKHADIFSDFGGHSMAAGFTLALDNLEIFKEELKNLGEKINEEDLIPAIEIDAVLEAGELTPSFWTLYEKLSPFGDGNKEPVFLMEDLEVKDWRPVGNGEKHLKMKVAKNEFIFNAIGFNLAEAAKQLDASLKIDMVFHLRQNFWNGQKNIEFHIIDFKPKSGVV